VSADGGASWQLNTVSGNHVVANPGYFWTGTEALMDEIYLFAENSTGIYLPSRVIKEGSFYYSIADYGRRDFSKINPGQGVYMAPSYPPGFVLIRTNDITNPNGWEAWTGGSNFQPLSQGNYSVFLPQRDGKSLNAPAPQIIFDVNAQCYILIHTIYGGVNAISYMTTKSLANPIWSESTPIAGTSGFNFEFTSGSPMLFYSTAPGQHGRDNLARDVYRIPLTVTYQ
jgi:hypothetical protein